MDKLPAVNQIIRRLVYKPIKNNRNRCFLCLNATTNDSSLCAQCASDLPKITTKCTICCKPLTKTGICGDCLSLPSKRRMTTRTAFLYDYPVDQLLIAFKFNQNLLAGRLLATLMAEDLLTTLEKDDRPDAIMPVPLHPVRLRQRGFNQALEIAKPISHKLGIPILNSASRRKNTRHQTDLNARQRRSNVHGAFEIKQDATDKHIAIIDDVITTGCTTRELAATLKRAGAKRVDAWSCALKL